MAVYTHLTDDQLSAIVTHDYGIGTLVSAAGITQGVENSNYHLTVRDAGQRNISYILTLYEKRMNIHDLPFFLQLMEHVAARGIACPRPVPRADGAFYGTVAGKHAAIVSFLEGESRTEYEVLHLQSVGEALAALHRATADFTHTRANALSLSGWQSMYAVLASGLDEITPGLSALVRAELDSLAQQWPSDLPRGTIHADLFPDNVFFIGDRVSGLIDFYFACTDMLAYDVAIVMNAWCFDAAHRFDVQKAAALLEGYQTHRMLTEVERAAFQVLLRGAAMRFLLTRAHDTLHRTAGAQVVVKDPMEYVAKLRFHQQMRALDEIGIA